MDHPLDFSFHKGNPLAIADDELESPKPMPKPPLLPHIAEEPLLDVKENEVNENTPFSSVAIEVIETLSISPARPSSVDEATEPSTSSAIENLSSADNDANGLSKSTVTNVPPVPKFSDDSQASSPKSKPRAKVPLERGFTQVDWLKLTRTQPDIAGLKDGTNRRLITKAEVKQHRSEDDAWTVLKGRVYNITPYLKFHPGGLDMLMKGAGKDCTALFNKYHSWVNAEYLLEKCLVGFLDVEH